MMSAPNLHGLAAILQQSAFWFMDQNRIWAPSSPVSALTTLFASNGTCTIVIALIYSEFQMKGWIRCMKQWAEKVSVVPQLMRHVYFSPPSPFLFCAAGVKSRTRSDWDWMEGNGDGTSEEKEQREGESGLSLLKISFWRKDIRSSELWNITWSTGRWLWPRGRPSPVKPFSYWIQDCMRWPGWIYAGTVIWTCHILRRSEKKDCWC